jgi:tetratricopeptide (TPR) repeat protein
MDTQAQHVHQNTRSDTTIVSTLLLVSLLFVFTLLYRCHFGIDLTDEGFYLNWIANPYNYKISHTQFGYIYHPLYRWVGESIVNLRQADMLIILGLSWTLCIQIFSYVFKESITKNAMHPFIFYGLTFSLATCVFSFFGSWWWIPTPSYNSLTLEALLITMIGLIKLSRDNQQAIGWVILGVGWWLTFMAKPTSAIILGLLSTSYIILTQFKTSIWRHLSLPFVTSLGLFCLSAYAIDGSILAFIERLHDGAKSMTLLYEGHPFDFWTKSSLLSDPPRQILFMIFTAFSLLITVFTKPVSRSIRTCFFLAVLIFCGLICIHYYKIPVIPNPTTNIFIWSIPLGACLTIILIPKRVLGDHASSTPTSHFIILSALLMLLPYAFAIGTRGNVWTTSLRMGIFEILAVIPLMFRFKRAGLLLTRLLIGLSICSLLITTMLVQLSMEYPYRQSQSLFSQTQFFEINNRQGRVTSHLILSDDDARYMRQLKQTALGHGFVYGDAMIDLTGAFPTALYLLGADPIGAPWYIAGFGGSTEYTVSILSQTPCTQLAKAWVITSLNGTEKYHPAVLEPHGLKRESYEIIEDIIDARFNLKHQFMKPKTDYAKSLQACEVMQIKQKNAQKIVQKMLKNKLPLSQNIITLSNTYLDKQELNNAVTLLSNAITVNPSNPILYSNLCVAYGIQKKYEGASAACRQALELDPGFQLARNNLNWVIGEQKQLGFMSSKKINSSGRKSF